MSISQIIRDVRNAVKTARAVTGASKIALIGIGLGATFAAMATDEIEVDQLVLWNPTAKGKQFIRAQKLLSDVLDKNETGDSDNIDSAGLYLTESLQDQFRTIDLTNLSWKSKKQVLLVSRSDMDSDGQLIRALSEKDVSFDHVTMPGYKEMMDQPTDTIVPVDSIDYIGNWISKTNATAKNVDLDKESWLNPAMSKNELLLLPADDVTAIELDETPV